MELTIEEIKIILEKIKFPERFNTDQTAICIMALLDNTVREGLLSDHKSLSEGVRIHDILNFARNVMDKKVAENTRESYRKTSLAPLMNSGIVVRHQLSTNDPNTYYRLHPDFMRLFTKKNIKEREELIKRQEGKSPILKRRAAYRRRGKEDVIVELSDKEAFSLSPGKHNLLEKSIVEIFARAFLSEPQVVYLGDTASRKGYQNRTLMRKLNLPIDTAASLPDVIVFSEVDTRILVIEAVTSSGPVNALRLKQLLKFTKGPWKLGYQIKYITAFPDRLAFKRFVEEIAWGSSVWIESEPNNIVHFENREGVRKK